MGTKCWNPLVFFYLEFLRKNQVLELPLALKGNGKARDQVLEPQTEDLGNQCLRLHHLESANAQYFQFLFKNHLEGLSESRLLWIRVQPLSVFRNGFVAVI